MRTFLHHLPCNCLIIKQHFISTWKSTFIIICMQSYCYLQRIQDKIFVYFVEFPFLYSSGDIPVCAAKYRRKELMELNPDCMAISSSGASLVRSSSLPDARAIGSHTHRRTCAVAG